MRNLNRVVSRDGRAVEQLQFLEAQGVLEAGDWTQTPAMPNYKDVDVALEDRARAYMDINCAHCHNPGGWEEPAEQGLDLRYGTSFAASGICDEPEELVEQVEGGEMPYLGTTLKHDAGVALFVEYVEGLRVLLREAPSSAQRLVEARGSRRAARRGPCGGPNRPRRR